MKYRLKPIIISEATVDKMLSTHSNAGYVIMSAWRYENGKELNNVRTKQLKADINASGYSYFPVWGGFVETDPNTGKTREVKEKSFVITNFKRGSNEPNVDSSDLKKLGLQLCKKYKQESFLYKPSGKDNTAYYITSSGKVDMKFNAASPTKAADVYFTNLKKSIKKSKDGKSFTYREGVVYMAHSPKSLSEAIKRYGENFFTFD